jgi:hypothetical protein
MTRIVTLLAVLLVTSRAAQAQDPAGAPLGRTAAITYTGTVTAIDAPARLITARGDDGFEATWEVPPSVLQSQIDAIRVGQRITVTYTDTIGFRRRGPGDRIVDTVDPTTRMRTATVTVRAIDVAASTITFEGFRGRTFTRRVADPANVERMRDLVVGELVDVSWFQDMTIVATAAPMVAPPPTAMPPAAPIVAPAPAADSLRDRLTVSVLWGPDNQFSGQVIEASTGRTTGGAPINLDKTTYDEVYGRMGLFKAGIGYRLSPRSEVLINFVYSESSAETVNVGTVTVGPVAVPLDVLFDPYKYWGFEGGQRFYFSRVRFTPYVGYNVGLNRFRDIRGIFVNLPNGLFPGHVAQDGKIFEKSWALSFGPTTGVLVGLGPLELTGEVALRFMGGLSDVDWLVEEGLRDINSKSSRWSVPILFGARFRF